MKLKTLSLLVFKEHYRYLVLSVGFLFLNVIFYIFSKQLNFSSEDYYLNWFNLGDGSNFGILEVLLKLINISIIFLSIGKIIDKLAKNHMIYIFARNSSYSSLLFKLTFIIILIAIVLLSIAHIFYSLFTGILLAHPLKIFTYLLIDIIGFISIVLIYIILARVFVIEHSFLLILILYIANIFSPYPILLTISTTKFLSLNNTLGIVTIILINLITSLIIMTIYYYIVKKRRINIC